MLSTLRAVAIIATIFMLSPTRQAPDPRSAVSTRPAPVRESPSSLSELRPSSIDPSWIDQMAKLWSGLPEAARGFLGALVRRAENLPEEAATPPAQGGAKPSRDTLRPDDRRPAWRGQSETR